jgi:hypothetical protein
MHCNVCYVDSATKLKIKFTELQRATLIQHWESGLKDTKSSDHKVEVKLIASKHNMTGQQIKVTCKLETCKLII